MSPDVCLLCCGGVRSL